MIDKLTLLNEFWFLPVLLAGTLLWLVFTWKEWSQSGRRRLLLKSLLSFLAIGALAGMALKPALPVTAETTTGVLLTPGYDSQRLDSLEKVHRHLKVMDYGPRDPLPPGIPTLDPLFVLGRGVRSFDLWQLEEMRVVYLGQESPTGVIKFGYQQDNPVNSQLQIKGLYNKPRQGLRLVLESPAGTGVDSVSLETGERQDFTLTADLVVQGNYLFSLVEKDSLGKEVTSDPVPVRVHEKDPVRILVINDFPTFETKYLKNYLAEAGHELMVRSRITRGRFKYEFFNMERKVLGRLSREILEDFDLLILDAGSLRNMSGAERGVVGSSVRESGLGIFIQPDTEFLNTSGGFLSLDFVRARAAETIFQEESLALHPFIFRENKGLEPVHSSDGRIYSAYQRMGKGRAGSSVFRNTYQLVLDGQTEAYQQVWSTIVSKISKKDHPLVQWESGSFMPVQDEPFIFRLRTAVPKPGVRSSNGSLIPLRSTIDLAGLWDGTTYPRETGWNKLVLQQDTTEFFDFYVTNTSHWKSFTDHRTIQENRRFFDSSSITTQQHRIPEPIDPLWFFGLFLLCIGFLWLEPKMSG